MGGGSDGRRLCWLPDVRRWADVVAGLLRPDGLLVLEYPYFETDGTVFVEDETYAGSGTVAAPESVIFNHGLGEIFTALLGAGLAITAFEEHREVPWNPLGEHMIPSPDFAGEFILAEGRDRMPLTYTLQATKDG